MIEIIGVTKSFSTDCSEVRAVDNVHFAVKKGEFILILGRSGSGKSTLLGMLSGLTRPTAGTIRINNIDLSDLSDDSLSELRAQEIGFVFQFSGLIPTITALENVMLPTLFCPDSPGSDSRAADLLNKVGMSERACAYPSTLSSGEMKRVAIARALVNAPAILIADEPTGDLDEATEQEIMELFRQLNREGTTIVMVTHNSDLVRYATRTYRMTLGKMTKCDEPVTSRQPLESDAKMYDKDSS